MITHAVRRLPVIVPCAFGFLLTACVSFPAGVVTATPMALPTPTLAIAPTYDVAHTIVTATSIGGGGPLLTPTATPCPTVVGATAAAARDPVTVTAIRPIMGTPAPIVTATPLVVCNLRTGPPTPTAVSGRLLTSPPPPPTHPGSPPTVPASTGNPATFTAIPSTGPLPTISAPGSVPATFTPIPPRGSSATGPIPPTTTATPGPPTPIPTATRVGVPPHRQFVSTVVDRTPGIPALPTPIATAPPERPAYTADEVRTYVLSNPPHGNKITTSAAPGYTVVAVTLTTIEQFDRDFGTGTEATQTPASTLMYVVELAGEFTMSGGPSPGFVNIYPSYVEVFDAHMGRLIIEGGFAR